VHTKRRAKGGNTHGATLTGSLSPYDGGAWPPPWCAPSRAPSCTFCTLSLNVATVDDKNDCAMKEMDGGGEAQEQRKFSGNETRQVHTGCEKKGLLPWHFWRPR
jgi:hypothetical protein